MHHFFVAHVHTKKQSWQGSFLAVSNPTALVYISCLVLPNIQQTNCSPCPREFYLVWHRLACIWLLAVMLIIIAVRAEIKEDGNVILVDLSTVADKNNGLEADVRKVVMIFEGWVHHSSNNTYTAQSLSPDAHSRKSVDMLNSVVDISLIKLTWVPFGITSTQLLFCWQHDHFSECPIILLVCTVWPSFTFRMLWMDSST